MNELELEVIWNAVINQRTGVANALQGESQIRKRIDLVSSNQIPAKRESRQLGGNLRDKLSSNVEKVPFPRRKKKVIGRLLWFGDP